MFFNPPGGRYSHCTVEMTLALPFTVAAQRSVPPHLLTPVVSAALAPLTILSWDIETAAGTAPDCFRFADAAWPEDEVVMIRATADAGSSLPCFVSGRPEDVDALTGALDGDALRAVDILHACAIQAIWRLRCQVAIDGLPVPISLYFSVHVLHLAEVHGLQLKQLDVSRRSRF